jgi:hypothetical protein
VIDGSLPSGTTVLRYEDVATDSESTLRRLIMEAALPVTPTLPKRLKWLDDEYRHQATWRTEL